MAILFFDGFETGDLRLWDENSSAYYLYAIAPITGTYSLYNNGSSGYMKKVLPSAISEIYFSFKCKHLANVSTDIPLFSVHSGSGNALIAIRADDQTDDQIEALVDTTQVAASGVGSFLYQTKYNIEGYFKLADSGGRIVVKIDGNTLIDYTGDTKPGSDSTFDSFRIGYRGVGGTMTYVLFDDLVIDDAAYPGNLYVAKIVPTGAGNSTQWDKYPDTGANYEKVDEIPSNSADYISTNVADEIDLYTCSDLPGTAQEVRAVQVSYTALYEGIPTPTQITEQIRTGGANYSGDSHLVPAQIQRFSKMWLTNPNTSNAWSVSEVNAMEIGVKALA